jgi:predicted signal transduction protein with EAL and GGDEF domain
LHQFGDRAVEGAKLGLLLRVVDAQDRMPDTSPEDAGTVMQRIKAGIEKRPLVDGLHVTASYGIAGLTPLSEVPEACTKLADETLYRAKALRRDRVVIAEQAGTRIAADRPRCE